MNGPLTFQSLIQHFLDPIERILERGQAKTRRYWPIIVVSIAVALSFALREPPYAEMAAFPATPYGKALAWWLDHPFSAVPVDHFFPPASLNVVYNAGCASHCDKLAFRATLPLLNQVLRGGVWTLILASNVAAILIFWLAYRLVLRDTKDLTSACFTTWALAGCYAGRYGFQDYICGDAVALAFLLGAMLARRPWLIAGLALFAGFTDERAIIAAPLVGLYHAWKADGFLETVKNGPPRRSFWMACLPILSAIVAYLVIRVLVTFVGHVCVGNTMLATLGTFMCGYNEAPPTRLVDSFAGLWLMTLLFVSFLLATQGWRSGWLWTYLALMGLALGPAFLVFDFERSLCYLLPGIMLSVCLLPFEAAEKRTLLGIALAASLLWSIPGSSFLAVQPERMASALFHLVH